MIVQSFVDFSTEDKSESHSVEKGADVAIRKCSEQEEPSAWLQELWAEYGMLHLPYRMMMVIKMLDKVTTSAIQREAGLSLAHWRVLAKLAKVGSDSVNNLADRSHVDPAEVSRAARALISMGLVDRNPHPGSRAKKILTLTADGKALAERLGATRRKFYGDLLSGFTESQFAQFDEMLFEIARRTEIAVAQEQAQTTRRTK